MRHLLLAAAGLAAVVSTTRAQAPPAASSATAAVVEQAGKYVTAYVEALSAIVSEEKQTQKLVGRDGRVRKTREITADFLLVKAQGTWFEAFRDVIDVDGKAVRNRE